MRFLGSVLNVLRRDSRVWFCVALLAAATFLPFAFASPVASIADERSSLEQTVQFMEDHFSNSTDPPTQTESLELETAKTGARAKTSQELYENAGKLERLFQEDVRNGRGSGFTEDELEAAAQFDEGMAQNDCTPITGDSTSLPMLYYFSYVILMAPSFIWLLPSVICLICLLGIVNPESLLGHAPTSNLVRYLGTILAGTVCCAVVIALPFVPCGVVTALLNGVGSVDFPIAYVQSQTAFCYPIAQYLCIEYTIILLGNVLLLVIGCTAFHFSRSIHISSGITIAFVIVPLVPAYFNRASIMGIPLNLIPLSYFPSNKLFSAAGTFAQNDIFSTCTLPLQQGSICLLVSSAALILIVALQTSFQKIHHSIH